MNFKDILVYLDDGETNSERVKAVCMLAQRHGARVTGVTPARLKPRGLKVSDSKAMKNMSEKAAQDRVDKFIEFARKQGLESEYRIIHGDESKVSKKMAQFARNFDLVILRQVNPEGINASMVQEISESVLLLSGRPVFFMPYIGAHRMPCKKAMIAWDGTPAATRAVHDSLPMLVNIDEVMILVVQEGKQKTAKGEPLADDLCAHLTRHGVNVHVRRLHAGTFDVPTVILNEVAENDTDLLIMGGYGTPSLKQKIFGGVTRTLLSSMIIPVFMSH